MRQLHWLIAVGNKGTNVFTKDEVAKRSYEKAEKFRRDQAAQLKYAAEEGRNSERLNSIRNLMESLHWTAQQAMDALKIPPTEQDKYAAQL